MAVYPCLIPTIVAAVHIHPTVRRIDFIAYLVGLILAAGILVASGYPDRSPAAVR
jgi:hypothetical protein